MIPRQRFFKRNRATGIKIRVKSRIGERLYPRVIAEKLIPAVKALTGFHSSIYRGGLPAIAFCKHCFNTSGTGIVVVISDLLGFDLALQELLTAFYLLDRLPLERCKRFRYKRSDGKGYIEIFPVPFL